MIKLLLTLLTLLVLNGCASVGTVLQGAGQGLSHAQDTRLNCYAFDGRDGYIYYYCN
jgi:uncharacterized protein YceK